ncbi:ATP-dependent zinc protease [Candidatus Woesearchaeota archaeon]|nr:ATP-dependent zinc protease [Candidatus Woesearchaeota archaeon]
MAEHQRVNGRIIVGLTESVKLISSEGLNEEVVAKVDTGATKSSIDTKLAKKLKLGPIIKSKMIKSAHGNRVRPIIEAEILLAGKNIKTEFTLADRTHMKYKVLIGINILDNGFLVDPSKMT